MHKTKYIQTVDAEIKVFMRAQRVREGESRAEMQFTKWTAEGAVKGGDMLVSRRAHGETVNQGGTAEIIFYEFTVLDRIIIFCQGRFFVR